MKVSIIELDARLYTMTSHLLMPKMGPLEVGTYLATHGHDVSVYVECMNGLDEAGILQSDIIGFSVGVGNATRVYDMVARLKPQSHATFVAGGPHATMVPDEALDHGFDYVVRAEGEETCRELLETLEENGEIGAVLGVSYLRDGAPVHNAPRPFMKSFELTPSYSLLKGFRRKGVLEQARLGKVYENFVQTTRGCPFPCDFCYENKIGGTGYRKRTIESIVDDIRYKIDFLRTNVFYITDANFGLDANFTKKLLGAILDAKIRARFTALMRIEIARDTELLALLKATGFEMLCIGSFEKDTEQTFTRIVDFALRHDMVGINIMVLGEYPDHPDCIVPSHRYFNRNWDYFPGHYLTFFMPRMRPSQFQRVVSREALRFYSRSNCAKSLLRSGWHGFSLKYGGRYVYRHVWKQAQTYLPYLENVERDHYEGNVFVSDDRLRLDYARSHSAAPKTRVLSTVSPTVNFSAPVPGF
jgi:hypothetical protein